MKMDISERQSYWSMGSSCQTREPAEKRLTWTMPAGVFGDDLYKVRVLARNLVASAAELWRVSYPQISGSPHDFLLDPDRYAALVAMEETWEEDSHSKIYCVSVVEEVASRKVVAAALLTKFEQNLQVEFSLFAIHPDYRRKDLTDELRRFTRSLALESGAEYFSTVCETWHDNTQDWCIRGGWQIAGISPGNVIRCNDEGKEYRGCTVHFYKFVGNGANYVTMPEEWYLAPAVRDVWAAMEWVNQEIEDTYHARAHKEMMRACALSP